MKEIYKKLLEVQKEIAPIKKTEDNPFFKSKYFDVNAILAALKPILSKHELVLTQPLGVDENGRNILCTVLEGGDEEQLVSRVYLPDVADPQKFGSAVTYFRRYALQSLFALEAEDDDANTASHGPSFPVPKADQHPEQYTPPAKPWNKPNAWKPPIKADPKHKDVGQDSAEHDLPDLEN